ncbi:MAG TPA: ABC transporter ATP-binding protein/permease, partial [Planctomycetaceae bacterium]|nr:ABC transporter ATP-binding protein/permease [Planctomycetaceae bacterium]
MSVEELPAVELIRLENVCKTYQLGEIELPVLRGISLSIARGEMVALMGASGSGKSTLMNILGCLDRPTSGEYWLDGRNMSRLSPNERAIIRTQKIGFVFQSFNLLPRTSALQNVLMPLDYSVERELDPQARRRARSLLGHVGLSDRIGHLPSQMSGGEQQRVAISRALINDPALLLADEPTGNLDSHTSVEILRMFQQLNAEGITVVLVTHDPQVAAYADRTIRIVDGMIESKGTCLHPDPALLDAPAIHADHAHRMSVDDLPVAANERAVIDHDQVATASLAFSRGNGSTAALALAKDTTATAAPSLRSTVTIGVDSHSSPTENRLRIWLPPLSATWRTALSALRRNKMRAGLSALGVIIAVSAVIAMTEIGQGSKALLQKNIDAMGSGTIMVFAGSTNTGGVSNGTGSAVTL